jgi:predicted nucleic acid-binding protein
MSPSRPKWTPRRLRADRGDPSRGAHLTSLLADAGPLYAYVDADDDHHGESLRLLQEHPGPILVPVLVVTQVAYLLATRLGPAAEVRFLGDLASGALTPLAVESIDWLRIAERDGRFPAAALAGLGPHRADQVALSA